MNKVELILILIAGIIVLIALLTPKIRKNRKKKREKKNLLKDVTPLENYEIRFLPVNNRGNRHPHYIFAEKGENVVSLNTTHHKPKGKKAIRLKHNPDPKDETKTYAVKELHLTDLEVSRKEKDRRKRGWSYTPKDIKKMEKWINK